MIIFRIIFTRLSHNTVILLRAYVKYNIFYNSERIKKMKKNRIISIVLAALLCTASLSACSDEEDLKDIIEELEKTQNPAGNPDETDNNSGENTTEVLGLSSYDWKYDDEELMLTIGGLPITFGEYRYYAMGYKLQADGGDESYWTDETETEFRNMLIDQFKQLAGIKLLATTKYGAQLNDDDYALIDREIEMYNLEFGEEFESLLDQNFVTEEIFRNVLEYDVFTEKLLFAHASEEEIQKYAAENYVHVQHVLVATSDENGNTLEGEAFEEKKKLANEITQRARNGEDFYSLVEQYGEDPGMENNPDGYTFTYGMMVEEFETESFRLAVGEISEPVETPYGYHIIKKLPLELKEDSQEYREIVYEIAGEKASSELQSYMETLEVVTTPAFDELTMRNIGTLKTAESAE